jgi:hypothetical protein
LLPFSEGLRAVADQPRMVPDEKAIGETTKVVREIYQDDLAAAKTAEQKVAVCKKFVALANASADDSIAQYVLLRQANALAVDAKNVEFALRADDETSRLFQTDLLVTKLATLEALNKLQRLPSEAQSIAVSASQLADIALAADQLKTANRLCEIAIENAKQSKDLKLAKQLLDKSNRFSDFDKQYQQFAQARATLEKNPQSPDANLIVGRYSCFVKGDWNTGLGHLALSSDEDLKRLANADLNSPSKPEDQTALGDLWWKLSETQPYEVSGKIQERARYWYQKALPHVDGFTKSKIEHRLKIDADSNGTGSEGAPVAKPESILKSVRVNENRIAGSWKLEKGDLLSGTEGGDHSLFQIPRKPGDEYKLSAIVTVEKGNNALAFFLPSQGSDFIVQFDGWDKGKQCSGISYIDGATHTTPKNPNGTRVDATIFSPGKPVRIEITVTRGSIVAEADGKIVTKWNGDFKRLSNPEIADRRIRPGGVYITTHETSYRLSALEISAVK